MPSTSMKTGTRQALVTINTGKADHARNNFPHKAKLSFLHAALEISHATFYKTLAN